MSEMDNRKDAKTRPSEKEMHLGSPIKRHLSREKSIPAVRGLSSSPFVVRIGVGETN
jgi:hypothetical protein